MKVYMHRLPKLDNNYIRNDYLGVSFKQFSKQNVQSSFITSCFPQPKPQSYPQHPP